jgi:hypothetical protein
MTKKNKVPPIEIVGMLYQKTNDDFNKDKPNPLDPLQIKNNPMQEEKQIRPSKKDNKNKLC